MPSDSTIAAAPVAGRGAIARLLDLMFGFFVWAIHFLLVYCANALACARGLPAASPAAHGAIRALLVGVTIVAMGIVALHAMRRWRGRDEAHPFMMDLTVGGDAIAGVGIALQLFPLFLLHLCR